MLLVVNDGDCVVIFHSIHRVMKAEKALKALGLDILLIPAPRQLSADCGMAIRYSYELHSEVAKALADLALSEPETWLLQAGKYHSLA